MLVFKDFLNVRFSISLLNKPPGSLNKDKLNCVCTFITVLMSQLRHAAAELCPGRRTGTISGDKGTPHKLTTPAQGIQRKIYRTFPGHS